MENPEVKMILIPKFQMKDKSLDDNYRSKELVVHIEVDFEVQNEEFMVQKFEVSISMELVNSANVSAQLT
jgi:hypothetical protein